MPYTVTSYPQGTFSWADFYSTDMPASKQFLTALFGWTAVDMPTGENMPDYTMFSQDGHYVAGGSPTFDPKLPSFWSNYVSVNDVDEMVEKAVKLGAKVTMPAMDVLDSGRMAVLEDPTGASISLWQPRNHKGAGLVNTVGAMCWNELYTNDVETAKDFYGQLFGWTFEVDPENGYTTIKNKDRMNGGIYKITPEIAGMPPCWVPYFTVKNIAETVKKVTALGGSCDMEIKDIGIGKIAMIADPARANFMIMEMSVKPEEWEE